MAKSKLQYNFKSEEKAKEKFCEKNQRTRQTMLQLDKWENEMNCPFYKLSKKQIEDSFKKLTSLKTMKLHYSYLDQYAKWYAVEYLNDGMRNNYFSQMFDNKEKEEIDNYIRMNSSMDKICKDRNTLYSLLNNTDCDLLEKAVVVLLYEGLNQLDIINLRIDWIFFNERVISLPNRKFQNIPSNSVKFIEESIKYDREEIIKDKLLYDKEYFYKRKNNAIRGGDIGVRTIQLISNSIEKFRDCINDKSIKYCKTPKDITNSGLFNYMLLQEFQNSKYLETDKEIKGIKYIFEGKLEDKDNRNINASTLKKEFSFFKMYYNRIADNTIIDSTIITKINKDEVAESSNEGLENKLGKSKLERGELGEIILKKELDGIYGKENVKKVKDKEGFDFQVFYNSIPVRDIEVKTIHYLGESFYITRNELEMNKNKHNYYLYLVVIKEKYDKAEDIKVIKDPIKQLSLDVNKIIGQDIELEYSNCRIQRETFKIKITDMDKIIFEKAL